MTDYLRVTGDRLQTPIRHYIHPSTGRRVTLIATMHFGDPAYFTGLRETIALLTAGGAAAHCEGSILLPCDAPEVTDAEHSAVAGLHRLHELEKQRFAALGLIGQIDGLGYPPHWQIRDLSYLDIIRRAGEPAVRDHITHRSKRRQRPYDRRERAKLLFQLTLGMRLLAASRTDPRPPRNAAALHPVLFGDRETLALDGFDGTDRDIVLIWGAKHLPGLHHGLTRRGLHTTATDQWRTITTLPPLGRAAWQALTSRRRPLEATR
ncbi:hypothetical protein [Paractinoplanes rishiriensis]|uniref:Uncharacterized protein n=1 Tax=Paractinoplanes rishiriensis TaxID=1050105 RepID=A0A919MV77_9ACTN|nr:hypothetical protein [Actinoplanes rishiriensis]GIF01107.1 hypothetical protein Ari01nite_85710 [Actinoplanes rishiriensis]